MFKFNNKRYRNDLTEQIFTCPKSVIETLEKGVQYVQS